MMPGRFATAIFTALIVGFLLAPSSLLVLFAFTSRGLANFPIESFSLRWWSELFVTAGFELALKNSLIISCVSALVSTVLSCVTSYGLLRLNSRSVSVVLALLGLPVILPPLVLAVALLVSFAGTGFGLGLHATIAAHLLFTIPFGVVLIYGRLVELDPTLVEAARDLGANPLRAFRTVTLPLLAPTLVGALLIAFALSIDDYIFTSFTIGGGNTLTTFVWGMMRTSASPIVNALGTIIIASTLAATVIALRLTQYKG